MPLHSRGLAVLLVLPALCAQPKKPFQAQSASSANYSIKDGIETLDTVNTDYELVGGAIPGFGPNQRLLLRKTTRTRQEIDAIGMEATTTVDAWPLGVDPKQKPLYSITTEGIDPRIVNGEVLTISRGLEETEWWSVYRLGTGARLFDTYAPLVYASIARDTLTLRYVGLEVPEDDAKDARLRAPNVVGVLTYASGERVIREALVTCDDPKRAVLMRSFADGTRTVSFAANTIRLSISQNYPSAPATVTIAIPITKDDLDFAKAQAPAGLHVASWKR